MHTAIVKKNLEKMLPVDGEMEQYISRASYSMLRLDVYCNHYASRGKGNHTERISDKWDHVGAVFNYDGFTGEITEFSSAVRKPDLQGSFSIWIHSDGRSHIHPNGLHLDGKTPTFSKARIVLEETVRRYNQERCFRTDDLPDIGQR